jgi:hypothetical protein
MGNTIQKLPRCEVCGVSVESLYLHRCRAITKEEQLADAVKLADQFGLFPAPPSALKDEPLDDSDHKHPGSGRLLKATPVRKPALKDEP